MKRLSLILLIFTLTQPGGLAQCRYPEVPCPRNRVQQLMRWERAGALLDQRGRLNASGFFLRSNDMSPKHPVVIVISHDYSLDDLSIQGDRAQVYFGFDEIGRIDSSLHWIPPDPRVMKYATIFDLVLSSKRWEKRPDGATVVRNLNPGQWLIEGSGSLTRESLFGDEGPSIQWLWVEAAIRYVKGIRDETKDPVIKREAQATLEKLLKLR